MRRTRKHTLMSLTNVTNVTQVISIYQMPPITAQQEPEALMPSTSVRPLPTLLQIKSIDEHQPEPEPTCAAMALEPNLVQPA